MSSKPQFKQMAHKSLLLAGLLCIAAPATADVSKTRRPPAQGLAAGAGAPANAAAQSDAKAQEEVVCFAGCSGKSGAVLSRREKPAETATSTPKPNRQSGWRRVGSNMWCHEERGCRSFNVIADSSDRNRDDHRERAAAIYRLQEHAMYPLQDDDVVHSGNHRNGSGYRYPSHYLHPGNY